MHGYAILQSMQSFFSKYLHMSEKSSTFARNRAKQQYNYMSKQIPCIVLAPYLEYEDGTQGCILVLHWQDTNPSVFLFNNPERRINARDVRLNALTDSEYEMLARYINEFEKDNMFLIDNKLQKVYKKYGVVRLAGNFLCAHIADLIGENVNRQKNQRHVPVDRVKEMLAGAHIRYTNDDLEDELLIHMGKRSSWEHFLIEEALSHITQNYNHEEWLNNTLMKIRNAFIDTFDHMTVQIGVDFGRRVAESYMKYRSTSWWRELEVTVSMKHMDEMRYSDFGFQEILAFYGLSQFIATNKPFDNFKLGVGPVPLPKRIELFATYRDNVVKECLTELQNMDNPHLSAMPTKQDAQKVAKEKIRENFGRVPEWLPQASREDYWLYEKAFCGAEGVVDFDKTKEKKIPFSREKAGIRAVHESGICKHKADWGAVFKILVEKDIFPKTAYLAAADFINDICGKVVTTKDALRQSPALSILGGSAESGWKNRAPENRESGRKVMYYQKIAQKYFSAI